MKVRDIMSTDVRRIKSDATVGKAADRTRQYDVGILPGGDLAAGTNDEHLAWGTIE